MNEDYPSPRIHNVHIRYYAGICDRLGIPYTLENRTRVLKLLTKSGKTVYCYKASTPLNLQSAVTLSKDKHELNRTLEPHGFPLPTQSRIKNVITDLAPFFKKHQHIVVKPADSHGGKGVTVLPKQEELEAAFKRARKESLIVIAETYITGKNYRFLVLDGKVLAVSLRLPPLIHGDGHTDIATLFSDHNIENKSQGLPRVPDSSYTWDIIASQGFTPTDIPPAGKEIYLRLTANLSLGGTVVDVTNTCQQSYKDLAVKVTNALGLRLAGIDIIAEDVTQPDKPAFILEANAAPGMRIHYKSTEGAKLDVATPIITAIYNL